MASAPLQRLLLPGLLGLSSCALGGDLFDVLDRKGPAFDCAKASTPAEMALCADPRLAHWDRVVYNA